MISPLIDQMRIEAPIGCPNRRLEFRRVSSPIVRQLVLVISARDASGRLCAWNCSWGESTFAWVPY